MDNSLNRNRQLTINGLTLDYSEGKLSIFGSLDIKEDVSGLNNLKELLENLEDFKHFLVFKKLSNNLPDELEDLPITVRENPFK